MNTALHMFTPLRFPASLFLLTSLYVGWWIVGLPLHYAPPGKSLHSLLLPACALACGMVVVQVRTVGTTLSVLIQRRAPASFVRSTLHNGLLQLGVVHLLLVVSIAFHFAVPKFGIGPLTAPAILSVVSCATLALVLANRAYPSLVAAILTVAALALLSNVDNLAALLGWINALPAAVLAPLALLWPLVVIGILLVRSETAQAIVQWPPAVQPDRLWRWLKAYWHSITFLGWERDLASAGKLSFGGAQRTLRPILFAVLFGGLVRAPADADLTGWILLDLGIYLALLCHAFPARNLHWRAVLCPGGWRSGGIGTRLWRAALVYYGGVILLVEAGFRLLFTFSGAQVAWNSPVNILVSALQLTALLAIAVLIRGALRNFVWPAIVLSALMVYVLLTGNELTTFMQLRTSAWYIPVLLATTLGCLAAANRVWTIDKLMAAART